MKFFLKALLVLLVIALAAIAYVLVFADQPEPFPRGSESAARLAPGPWSVESYKDTWVDRSRRTQPNGDYAGDRQRTMEGQVWFPGVFEGTEAGVTGDMRFPLLVFSHGLSSTFGNARYLGEHLASHGFVLVAADYPLTSVSAPGGPVIDDVVQQPGDVSFLIDSLLAASREEGHALYDRIETERIGALGISLGGLTSLLAGFHEDWRDPRIGAVLTIAAPTSFFTPRFFSDSRMPFLMLAGNQDVLVPYDSNARALPAKIPGAELVTVDGGSHTGFSHGTQWVRWMNNPDVIGCYAVSRSMEKSNPDDWAGLLGSADMGIDYSVDDELCKVDPLPEAMNVLRQHMIARVVVRAFFERYLTDDAQRQRAATRFLEQQLGQELRDVSYRRSRPLPPREPSGEDELDRLSKKERAIITAILEERAEEARANTGGDSPP